MCTEIKLESFSQVQANEFFNKCVKEYDLFKEINFSESDPYVGYVFYDRYGPSIFNRYGESDNVTNLVNYSLESHLVECIDGIYRLTLNPKDLMTSEYDSVIKIEYDKNKSRHILTTYLGNLTDMCLLHRIIIDFNLIPNKVDFIEDKSMFRGIVDRFSKIGQKPNEKAINMWFNYLKKKFMEDNEFGKNEVREYEERTGKSFKNEFPELYSLVDFSK